MLKYRPYTGVGSRETPEHIQQLMFQCAKSLTGLGYTLRSGGAEGADTAFESGSDLKEIYLPWAGFNNRHMMNDSEIVLENIEAMEIAATHHPAWERCSQGAMKMHTRNVHQILGKDLRSPSEFLLCWTPNGATTGGTGQAIRLAEYYEVPIFNLGSSTPEDISEGILKITGDSL